MFFDDYYGEHQGKLTKVDYKPTKFGQLYRLIVKFDKGYNSGPLFPNELVIQPDRPLGRRLSLMHLEDYVDKTLRIKRDGNLFWFYDANDKCIGLVGLTEEWTKTEDEEWFDNLKYKYNYEDQARFFGRTIEEVKKRDEEKFYSEGLKRSLTATTKGTLNEIKGIPESILTFGVSIYPEIKDFDGAYYGESFKVDVKSQIIVSRISSKENTLFGLSKEEGLNLTMHLQKGDIITIQRTSDEDLLNHAFFRNGLPESDFYVWLKLEDFHEGSFSSYSFAFGRDLEDLMSFTKTNEADFLRHIMFLRSKQTESLNAINKEEQKNTRFQAIRSAIAVIMSRNMSHNLGSHVLYYTQQDLIETSNEYDKDLYQISHAHDETELRSKLTKLEYVPYSSSLRGCSFLVSFLKNRTNYVAAIAEDVKFPSLPVSFKSEIWDFIINIDKNTEAKKTVNYYLKNLIKSEGFTRSVPHGELKKGELRIEIDSSSVNSRDLNYMSLSLPGGTIAIQAFCNIIENFIRNSAKYWTGKNDSKIFNLIFTFKLSIDNENLCILIYDNKGDAEYNLTNLQNKLDRLIILNEDGSLNKEDKGLKEMILSYLWLRSDAYNESLSKYIYKLDSEVPDIRKRIKENIKSSFCYCEVENNLGLKFYLPIHYVRKEIDENTSSYEKIHADVVSARKEIIEKEKLDQIFPRITTIDTAGDVWNLKKECVNEINENHYRETQELYRAICTHFNTNIDDYKLYFERSDPNQPLIREAGLREMRNIPYKQIYFSTHLNAKQFTSSDILDFYSKYLYVDSISGGNYTKVLEQLLDSSFDKYYHLNTWENKLLSLKIKESAVTRITIIDERLFGGVEHWINLSKLQKQTGSHSIKDSQIELSLRNIRVLNWRGNKGVTNSFEKIPTVKELPIFCGNEFRDVGPYSSYPQKTNFLTIHLGIIEEMLKSDNNLINNICGVSEGNPLSNERISKLMSKIQEVFDPDFICIHSGRGGLSEETEKTILCQYPFLPFSTLESVFNDSKFLLSQMFYSMKYKKIL